jgi:hypothetical protein
MIYVVPLLILFLIEAVGLWRMSSMLWGMYANTDGMWAAWNANGILNWGLPFDLSPFNPLSGMGSVFLPNTPWLNPAAMALALPGPKEIGYLVGYFVYFAELAASTILLCRAVGLSRLQSILCSQLYLLLLFPPSNILFGTLSWFSLAPVNAHLVSLSNAILALLCLTGRYGTSGNLACGLGIVFAAVCGFYSAPVTFLTYVPAYGAVAAALTLTNLSNTREISWKVGTLLALGFLFWAIGTRDYLQATSLISTRGLAAPYEFQLAGNALSWTFWRGVLEHVDVCAPLAYMCPLQIHYWFTAFGLAGASIYAVQRTRLRPLAITVIIYIIALHLWDLAGQVALFGSARIVSAPFLLWAIYPFIAQFVTLLILFVGGHIIDRTRSVLGFRSIDDKFISSPAAILLVLVVPGIALLNWELLIGPSQPPPATDNPEIGFLGRSTIRHAQTGPIVKYLIQQASLAPGAQFRGYTVSYFSEPDSPLRKAMHAESATGNEVYNRARQYFDDHYGNRLLETDLWENGIPTLEEYGQWIARPVFQTINALFDPERDALKPIPSFLRVYRLDPKLLPFLGVRFLITDLHLEDSNMLLRAQESGTGGAPAIFLYETVGANLGTWSPTSSVRAETFAEVGGLLKARSADLQKLVVSFEPVEGTFVPAERPELRMVKGGFHVVASSSGESLILLPIQYSRCWEVFNSDGSIDPTIHLYRTNGFQTLVRFAGRIDARFRFRYGLFGSSACRLQDYRDTGSR